MSLEGYVVAKTTFHWGHQMVLKASVWSADAPVVRACADNFTDDPEELHRVGLLHDAPQRREVTVEQATAEPGERRNVARRSA